MSKKLRKINGINKEAYTDLKIKSNGQNLDNTNQGMRLNKFLSDAGVCSRREADRLIENGLINLDNEIAKMGSKVYKDSVVIYNNMVVKSNDELILLALNKPVGIECTSDRNNVDNIIDFIDYPTRVFTVGRLDKNSSGLILLTNDGDLANKISKSSNCHEKEYIVKVNKKISDEFLDKMSSGVNILDTVTKPCKVTKINDNTFNIILTQGLNRQIRRMCLELGYKVNQLKRVRIMNIKLGKLLVGTYRKVSGEEIDVLMKSL